MESGALYTKGRDEARRIFALAVLVSLCWHIFWLSAIKIVSAPQAGKTGVKFSRVSFLGPILERGAIELRMAPKERSFLEKRYMRTAQDAYGGIPARSGAVMIPDGYGFDKESDIIENGELVSRIDKALSEAKPEPPASLR